MKRRSNFIWGTLLLLAAALVLINQLDGFANISTGSIILTVLALAFLVQCIIDCQFTSLPIPLAVLYIIFQAPLKLPYIKAWPLIAASVIATAGLSVLFPRSFRFNRSWHGHHRYRHGYQPENSQAYSEDNDNNPSIGVNFGYVSRHLTASSLETARLSCRFGAMEVYFDKAVPGPAGAEAILDCRFGACSLLVPKHWLVIDRLNCTLGGVETNQRHAAPAENAPRLTLSGSVSLGGIEVKYI